MKLRWRCGGCAERLWFWQRGCQPCRRRIEATRSFERLVGMAIAAGMMGGHDEWRPLPGLREDAN